MPIRPFPIPYSIGTDICHVPRISKLLFTNYPNHTPLATSKFEINHRFLSRIFTAYEVDNFWQRQTLSKSPNLQKIAEHVAGRWAAKEAIIKASGKQLSFQDIVVFRSGREAAILDPSPADSRTQASTSELSKEAPPSGLPINPSVHSRTKDLDITEDDLANAQNTTGAHKEHALNIRAYYPRLAFDIRTRKHAQDWEGQMCKVSISHDGEYATATAIVCNEGVTANEPLGEKYS